MLQFIPLVGAPAAPERYKAMLTEGLAHPLLSIIPNQPFAQAVTAATTHYAEETNKTRLALTLKPLKKTFERVHG